MDNTIEAHGLVKRFGATTALDGVDLVARTGTVLAVLGPNGAGRPPPCASWPPCSSPTRAGPWSAATTSSPRPSRSAA